MHINKFWKKQLLACVGVFFVMLALGLILHYGFLIIIGTIVMCFSAVLAERGTLCPNCKESLFKEMLEPKACAIECPKCKKTVTLN